MPAAHAFGDYLHYHLIGYSVQEALRRACYKWCVEEAEVQEYIRLFA